MIVGTRFSSYTIKERADQIIDILGGKGFVIQRYDSYSTNSIYLKLDYGVCNSIRISDHGGKKHLHYRYNMIMGCEDNIVEEKYIRYYFNESNLAGLINQILFDKAVKLKKYGKQAYRSFMVKNMDAHKHSDGFWKDAKVVTGNKSYIDPVTGEKVYEFQIEKSRPKPNNPIKLTQMPDGTYACGPQVALNVFADVISNQMQLDANAKFKPNEKVRVTASFDELVNYYATANETINQAKTHALQILGKGYDLEQYDVGTVIGATKCDEGTFYTIELPLIPMEFLPEDFLSKA